MIANTYTDINRGEKLWGCQEGLLNMNCRNNETIKWKIMYCAKSQISLVTEGLLMEEAVRCSIKIFTAAYLHMNHYYALFIGSDDEYKDANLKK